MLRQLIEDALQILGQLARELHPPPVDGMGKDEARRNALAVLAEAEALLGPSPVLDAERRLHGAPVSSPETPRPPGDGEAGEETAA